MSAWQFIFPSLMVAFLFGVINLLIFNPIGSLLLSKYEKIEAIHLKGQLSTIAISNNGLWLKENTKTKNIIIHALRVSQDTKELFDVTYIVMNNEYKFLRRIDATSAKLNDNNSLEFLNASIINFDYTSEIKDLYSVPTKLNFNQIIESVVHPDTISIYKLPSFIKATQDSGFSILKHLNYFYKLIISPIFYFSMVFIGIVFATSLPRSGKSALYMFVGILTGFLIYFVTDIVNAIGLSGNIPIVFSALAPTLICLSIGLYLVLHYEDG
jgi:lipopolysaccharide export system permease protein